MVTCTSLSSLTETHRLDWDILSTHQITHRFLEWLENFIHRNHRFIKLATHETAGSREASITQLSNEDPQAVDSGMSSLLVAGIGACPKMCRQILGPFIVASGPKLGFEWVMAWFDSNGDRALGHCKSVHGEQLLISQEVESVSLVNNPALAS